MKPKKTPDMRVLWSLHALTLASALWISACCRPLPEPPIVVIEADAAADACMLSCAKLRAWGCREGADSDAGTCESDCRRVVADGLDIGQACVAKASTLTEARGCTTKHGAPAVGCR